jgi:hypothetical protein
MILNFGQLSLNLTDCALIRAQQGGGGDTLWFKSRKVTMAGFGHAGIEGEYTVSSEEVRDTDELLCPLLTTE